MIKTRDWIIDLGPVGGDGGGEIVFAGPPEEIAREPRSYTARFLKPALGRRDMGGKKSGERGEVRLSRPSRLYSSRQPADEEPEGGAHLYG